jgi:hypothetical protein
MANNIIDELLELAVLEEEQWPARLAALPEWHPRNESGSGSGGGSEGGSGSGGGDGGGDGGSGSGSGSSGSSGSGDDDDDNDDDDDAAASGDKIDWKKMARRHEREAKKERKERERLQREAKDRETADQTDHEKAVQAAREEGEKKALETAAKERRGDRLENAVIKAANRGVKLTVKEDDKEVEKTLKFTDPDDAFVHIERMIRNGDLEEDELFDDKGRVNSDALTEALGDLLDAKPHLVAGASGNGSGSSGGRKVKGSADGGKGSGGSKSAEDMSIDEHFERIRQRK